MPSDVAVKEPTDLQKKRELVSSRIRNYEYSAEDYDRRYGKGSFFKKHPESKKLLDQLYVDKVACMDHEAKEALNGEE